MSALADTSLTDTLKKEFQDEDYRYAYDEEFANSRMATQIKVIREQRGLKQTELANLAEMKQSRISALEDVNYNSWSISTLRRLARALGVRLFFGFESWGELLPEIDKFGRKALEKPSFDEDSAFQDANEPQPELTKEGLNIRLTRPPKIKTKIIDTLDVQVVDRIHIKPEQMPRPRQIEFSFKALRELPRDTVRRAKGTSKYTISDEGQTEGIIARKVATR